MTTAAPVARPLLLLDVDGVLQPVGSSVPPGYQRIVTDDATVVLQLAHGRWLAELADDVEIVWASTWGERANRLIGARLGLPELTHIELADLPRDGTRKLQAVKSFVGVRPFAWIDDELYEDAFTWAEERRAPTLLRRTRGSVGLTREDLDAVAEFVRELLLGSARSGARTDLVTRGLSSEGGERVGRPGPGSPASERLRLHRHR